MAVQTQIQVRRGTAASWTSTNPTLAAGEIGLETDTGKYKIGDGSSTWTSLAYYPTLGANTFTGAQTATSFIVTGSTAPANGMYLPAANTLGFASNSTERMRIDSAGQISIGGTPNAGQTFAAAKNITGAAFATGIISAGTIQSDVTNRAAYFHTYPSTNSSAFTLNNLHHYFTEQGTFGAGSTVSNQYGFTVSSNLTGATNNYGFYGNIPAGTGRYNLYMAGTANNYMAGALGIGSTTLTGFGIRIQKPFTGATTAFGIVTDASIQSDVTSAAFGYYTGLGTQAASFTLSNLTHYYATQGSIGAGSTITSQYGFLAESTLTGATNGNYGFFGGIASGAGRWNFFAGGTAANYFAGQTIVGSTSLTLGSGSVAQQFGVVSTAASNIGMVIRGAASQTGDLTQWQDSAGSVLVRIDSAGKVGIGAAPTHKLDVYSATGDTVARLKSASVGAGLLFLQGSNSTYAGYNSIKSVDDTNTQQWYIGGNGVANTITFQTISTERMRIDSSGNVGIGTTSPAAKLDVNGSFNSTNYSMAGKNAVINGGFDIWQRGTSVSVSASSAPYTTDRWVFSTGASAASTVSRQTTSDTTNLPNIQYCARVQRNSGQTGTGANYFAQSFETVNSIPFVGKQVTLSFYARAGANFSGASNLLGAFLVSGTGTDQNVITAYTGTATVATSNVTLTTTWQRFTVTGTVSSSATELAIYFSYTPSGTAGANDYYEITGVQLEVGSVATPFSRNGGTIQGELAACQRYYLRLGSNSGNTYTTYAPYGSGYTGSTTEIYSIVTLPVSMRVRPTAIEYANLAFRDSAGNFTTLTSLVSVQGSQSIQELYHSGLSGLTANRPGDVRNNNNTAGYLAFSAEL